MKKTTMFLVAGAMLLPFASATQAAVDLPKRKPGLWEIQTRMEGMPKMGPVQHCIDSQTDNLMQQQAEAQQDCSVMEVKRQGGTVNVRSVCKVDGSTATMTGTFSGAFDSAYQGDMHVRYDPPMHGMREARMQQQARWLGPCKPGQKPGDMIMPNMGGMNLNEMMNDSRLQEMMRQHQGR